MWYEQGNKALFSTSSVNAPLVAVVEPLTANDVQVHVLFEPNAAHCNKCSNAGGTSLYPGDLMFSAYDNRADALASEQDLIQIRNQLALEKGTHFLLTEGVYEGSSEHWFSGDGRMDASIASQQITYIGTAPIPAHSNICFRLEQSGSGDALLAKDFYVNNISRNGDFCVKNVGNTLNPKINLSTTQADALFLMQGEWKFESTHGIFCGKVLSGLQYGGHWLANGSNLPPNSRRSQIPSDIECIYLEDSDAPSNTYAQYDDNHHNNTYTTILDYLIDWNANWTENNSGADLNCSSTIVLRQTTQQQAVQLYPNPFLESFTVALKLQQAQALQLRLVDVRGQLIAILLDQKLEAGQHQWQFSPQSYATGLYILQVITPQGTTAHKLIKGNIKTKPPIPFSPSG